MAKKPCTVGDLSAVVTGLLLAYNLPASVPLWMPVVGTLLAIVLVKMIFGGLGANFVNPALTARAILMTSWVDFMSGGAYQTAVRGLDAVSAATPLAAPESYSLWQLFAGQCPGCIGEVGRVALLVGGVYLMVRKVISWRIPVFMLGTLFVCTWLAEGSVYAAASPSSPAARSWARFSWLRIMPPRRLRRRAKSLWGWGAACLCLSYAAFPPCLKA